LAAEFTAKFARRRRSSRRSVTVLRQAISFGRAAADHRSGAVEAVIRFGADFLGTGILRSRECGLRRDAAGAQAHARPLRVESRMS
jgi:hypothetical protein